MNCNNYQDLLSEFIDESLSPEDQHGVAAHLSVCEACSEARTDLGAILGFCVEHRDEYESLPNERALWLRISNMLEVQPAAPHVIAPPDPGWWFRLMNRSWQLSFPQLAAAAAGIVIVVALFTVVGLRGFNFVGGASSYQAGLVPSLGGDVVKDRYRQQQQVIAYWNERVELNKARWNPQMRETFEKNMSVIDTAVNETMSQLSRNPHDEVSEEILNAALNDKVELLKEFAAL